MDWPAISLRSKIMGTIVLVTTVVVALGGWTASEAVQDAEGRGRYLERHWERHQASGTDLGTSEYVLARLIANDTTLGAALEAGDAAQVTEAGKRALETLQGALAPDLFVVSDAAGNTFSGGGLKGLKTAEWRGSRLFQDLREGRTVRGKLAIIERQAYRV